MDTPNLRKYFFVGTLLLLIVLSFLVIRPFLMSIITALILAYIFYPVYVKIKKFLKKKALASIITTLLVILIITIPLSFVVNAFAKQTYAAYLILKKEILAESSFSAKIGIDEFSPQIKLIILNAIEKSATNIINYVTNFIMNVPKMIIGFLVMVFVMFYTFTTGKEFVSYLFTFVPLKEKSKKHLAIKFKKVVSALIYGIILIGIIQGILGTIGFYIFKIPTPLFWGIVMTILSILPVVGTWLVWIPAAILKILGGELTNGIGLFIYGALIITYFESFVKSRLVGKRANIHALVVLLGVFGGIALFGLIGIVIGPLILGLTLTFIDIYREEIK